MKIVNIDNEFWVDVQGYEKLYQISNYGRVKSKKREYYTGVNNSAKIINFEKLMKIRDYRGYLKLRLCKNSKKTLTSIHRLIAIHFIPNPENKPYVNHINGIKHDNRIENLEWCTCKENTNHAFTTGLRKMKKGNESWHNKPILIIDEINNKTVSVYNQLKAAEITRVHSATINAVLKGRKNIAKGLKFEYIC